MDPGDVINYARQQYNAANDQFFSDAELYRHVWHAQDILAKEAKAIENTYTSTTTASQQEYAYPTRAIAIKRITCDGKRLDRLTFRDDDVLTGLNAATTASGTPRGYILFDRVIYLRPIPASAVTLKIFTFDRPDEVSASSTLDVPDEFHLDLVNFLLWRMAAKDQNFQAAKYYQEQWGESVARAKQWSRKRMVADGLNVVRDEDAYLNPWEVF